MKGDATAELPVRAIRKASLYILRRKLPELIKRLGVDQVVFAYSDVSHLYVMHKARWLMRWG